MTVNLFYVMEMLTKFIQSCKSVFESLEKTTIFIDSFVLRLEILQLNNRLRED